MAGLPGEAYAELLNTVLGWLLSPSGYAALSREQKLKAFHDALLVAVANRDMVSADAIYAGLRRLSAEAT